MTRPDVQAVFDAAGVTPPEPTQNGDPNSNGQPRRGKHRGQPMHRRDVSNTAICADWLRDEIGTGPLAGMFCRGEKIVHVPREGEDGYIPLTDRDGDDDGPAQVRPLFGKNIAARIQYTYDCYRHKVDSKGNLIIDPKTGEPKEYPAMFPIAAANTAANAVDMLPNLRKLRGVTHAPLFRADGTLIETPGYDPQTGIYYLPDPGLNVPPVPDRPTDEEVRAAFTTVLTPIMEFPFVTEHDRANYLGMLLTPLLRNLAPPPYKLAAIEARQPGSGKTYLAEINRAIHGGVFRVEMPENEAELRKQISTILDVTTGPVVVIDNVSGVLSSSVLSGLLTRDWWDDRKLGGMEEMISRPNDRFWMITGNNLDIRGDIPRRTLRSTIDPRMPNPEQRDSFVIENPVLWADDNRDRLLHALLTLIRAWVVAGRELAAKDSSDSYALWVRTVRGILDNASTTAGPILDHHGNPQQIGTFDHQETRVEAADEDEDWGDFLEAVHAEYGVADTVDPNGNIEGVPWTVKALLAKFALVDTRDDFGNPTTLPGALPINVLPTELATNVRKAGNDVKVISKTLGRWLRNREGRWFGQHTVKRAGKKGRDGQPWRIVSKEGDDDERL